MPDHQALHRKSARLGIRHGNELCQPVRLCKGIVVEQHHIFAFCQADARVHRCGKAGVCLVLHQRVARAAHIAAGNGQALVCGAVVDDDKFKVLLRLRPDRFNGIAQPARAVQIRYYNTCFQKRGLL